MDMIQNKDFKNFIKDIKQKIYSAKNKAILSANRLMIELYFDIGKEIVTRQEKYGWGKSIVEQMSEELKDEKLNCYCANKINCKSPHSLVGRATDC